MSAVLDRIHKLHPLRHLLSAITSAVGASMVFTFVMTMNEYSEPPDLTVDRSRTEFGVEQEKKPKKKRSRPEPRKVRRKAPSRNDDHRTPIPNLASNISGAEFNIPGLVDPGNVGRRALVDSAVGQTARQVVMTQDAVDEPARARMRVAPSYPVVARRKGITGFVTFNIMIDERGQARRIQILEASPAGVFEAEAQRAIEQWEFEAAVYGGEPVQSWVKQTIRFNLR